MLLSFLLATNVAFADGFYTKEQCDNMPGLGMTVPSDCDHYKSQSVKSDIKKDDKDNSANKKCKSIKVDICKEFKYFERFRKEKLFHDYGFSGMPVAKKYSDWHLKMQNKSKENDLFIMQNCLKDGTMKDFDHGMYGNLDTIAFNAVNKHGQIAAISQDLYASFIKFCK